MSGFLHLVGFGSSKIMLIIPNRIRPSTPKPDRITVDMEGWTVDGLQNRTQPNKWTESRAIIAAVAMPGTDPTGL